MVAAFEEAQVQRQGDHEERDLADFPCATDTAGADKGQAYGSHLRRFQCIGVGIGISFSVGSRPLPGGVPQEHAPSWHCVCRLDSIGIGVGYYFSAAAGGDRVSASARVCSEGQEAAHAPTDGRERQISECVGFVVDQARAFSGAPPSPSLEH